MDVILVVIGLLVVANFIYIWRSNHSLRKLVKSVKSQELDDKSILDHIIYTRTSFNGIYTTIALITFVLTFWGIKEKNQLETALQKGMEEKAEIITQSTKDNVNRILAINLDTLIQKRDAILEIAADVQRQKKKFDNIVNRKIMDSLYNELAKIKRQIEGVESGIRDRMNAWGRGNPALLGEIDSFRDRISKLENALKKVNETAK